MLLRGLNTRARSLPKLVIWATLFGIAFLIYLLLKKKISQNRGLEIYNLLLSEGFGPDLAKYQTSQAAFETAGFTSKIFRLNNNAFGMKDAGQPLSLGEKNGYAYYNSISGSVSDFARWYRAKRNYIFSFPLVIDSLDKYVTFMKNNNYFEADRDSYFYGTQFYYNKLFK
jgi:hypothetical protein